MGAPSLQKNSRVVLSEINVTPFVDVMLVLLIIFMVTAPMLQQGISLSLPETRSAGLPPTKEPFVLEIRKNKEIYIGTENIPMKKLSAKLKAIFKSRSDNSIYVQADKNLSYGIVANALAEINAAGVTNINLVTTTK